METKIMTFSRTETLIISIGLKLSVVVGFVASLGLVGSLFLRGPFGHAAMAACGCGLAMAMVSVVYLAVCQAVIAKLRKGEGA